MKLYKYLNPQVVDNVFIKDGHIGLKCDFPMNYNDPFELFVTIKSEEVGDSDYIAYFYEILGEIPQLPTTCFSKRPDVVPMWAHYAREHTGITVELDEVAIAELISFGHIEDVTYSESAAEIDLTDVAHAAVTGKPRHTFLIQSRAYKSAYFTKHKYWEYEYERRLVVHMENITENEDLLILFLPHKCVTAIISGSNAGDSEKRKYSKIAETIGCPHYQMKISRASYLPFFVDNLEQAYVFDGAGIKHADNYCGICSEPISEFEDSCLWCSLNKDQKVEAASRNPMRMLHRYGLLHNYPISFPGVNPIGYKTKQDV